MGSIEIMSPKPPIRIGNVSGATGDAPSAMYNMVSDGHIDGIVGDWLSEMNIAWNGIAKQKDPELGYEAGFLHQLRDSIDIIAEKKIKIVTNAGALNTAALTRKVQELCESQGHGNLSIASVYGDDVSHLVTCPNSGYKFPHLDDVKMDLGGWNLKPAYATAYIGAWGIIAALRAGADIVICGRVTDASPVIGLSAWWHGWSEDSFDQLAGALVAGRELKCCLLKSQQVLTPPQI
jgi:hypothetical protein